ncbi:MAG: hypothetical protein PHI97_09535 [Desulfobulbus sp.]|nr:hypothetical protein [Desulfobulbus sp.]
MKKAITLVIMVWCLFGQLGLADECVQGEHTHIWVAPQMLKPGIPVRLMAVSTQAPITEIQMTDPQGETRELKLTANTGGLPWSVWAELDPLESGLYRFEAQTIGTTMACRELALGADTREAGRWDEAHEAFYAAWIERMFDGELDEDISFPSLEPVLRDPVRNFLHNALGEREDDNLPANPDCADFPYFLRSYFSWKIGLPFSYRFCNRGTSAKPPTCDPAILNTDFAGRIVSQAAFKASNLKVMNAVQSGNGRTGLVSQETDFYPLPLQRDKLWPGTIYADPYGHVLVLSKWLDQTPSLPGILFAVDAQPDNSIARKRFWEGTFLFTNIPSAGPGFKAFRPLDGHRLLKNEELPNFSPEQAELSPDEFYAQLFMLINPQGLDAKQAYEATLAALVEQLQTRVTSLDNGEAYFRKGGATIGMPRGAAIFETVGPWEDYSTPSRDMRLIIAMNVLLNFSDKVVAYPQLFRIKAKEARQIKVEIEQLHDKRIQETTIQYTRSDGEPWELTIADVLERKPAFEMGYNPNDCVEIRWGAEPGSDEYASCRRHAPSAQTKQMVSVRDWFREAKRPPR